jgi:hypothetical protein
MTEETTTKDKINPSHYKDGYMEVWEQMIRIWGVEAFIAHCQMTAYKYRMRLGKKDGEMPETDYKKAKWYEDMAIICIEANRVNNFLDSKIGYIKNNLNKNPIQNA